MPPNSTQTVPPEEQIMRTWDGARAPLVSVICTTYNHADYIEDALRGFLTQVTDFPFEVLVHDDASTDGTAAIVLSYAARYPNIIRPICQTENQFSKGRKPAPLAMAHACGTYVALCEGDDFWTDTRKLHRQVRVLEEHESLDLCWHECHILNVRSGRLSRRPGAKAPSRWVPTAEIIEKDGGFIPTLSIMMRREAIATMPDWFCSQAPVGDYFYQIYSARRGGGYYIADPMGVYRFNHAGSWSSRTWGNAEKRLRFEEAFHKCLTFAEPDFPGLSSSFSILMFRHFALLGHFAIRWRSRAAFDLARLVVDRRKEDLSGVNRLIAAFAFAKPWTLFLK
jgi:glycosyltransferase involved in cell wall biosynthesis